MITAKADMCTRRCCRELVEAGYSVVIRAMFAQLERTAGPDVKHGDRLRLENYTLLETELQPLADKVGDLPYCQPSAHLLC